MREGDALPHTSTTTFEKLSKRIGGGSAGAAAVAVGRPSGARSPRGANPIPSANGRRTRLASPLSTLTHYS